MSAPASRRLFLTAAGFILATLPIIALQPVQGEEKEKAKPQVDGILWCIGSVQYRGDGQPRIDLGDAHGLTEGSEIRRGLRQGIEAGHRSGAGYRRDPA